MFISRKAGSTSVIIQIAVKDCTSTTGALLPGLAFNTSGLAIYYSRTGAPGDVVGLNLVTATKGTWTSQGFIAVDENHTPGLYELHLPNAAVAAGSTSVIIHASGAANMLPLVILIELTAIDNQDPVRAGLSALPNAAAATNGGLPTNDNEGVILSSAELWKILNLQTPSGPYLSDIFELLLSWLAGKSTGGGSTEIRFRDFADTRDAVILTVDSMGNRSAVLLNLSS
jgi:hypothetical protein